MPLKFPQGYEIQVISCWFLSLESGWLPLKLKRKFLKASQDVNRPGWPMIFLVHEKSIWRKIFLLRKTSSQNLFWCIFDFKKRCGRCNRILTPLLKTKIKRIHLRMVCFSEDLELPKQTFQVNPEILVSQLSIEFPSHVTFGGHLSSSLNASSSSIWPASSSPNTISNAAENSNRQTPKGGPWSGNGGLLKNERWLVHKLTRWFF